ncbi:hypothetical protein U9M48_003843 [Paspalum notatum var. saurae]|uniref:Uncharacterized protein n=1 Tax=Paspalum notatum var. saurae TaxID=547442 RepID=A0AAQ3SEA8_PASNO
MPDGRRRPAPLLVYPRRDSASVHLLSRPPHSTGLKHEEKKWSAVDLKSFLQKASAKKSAKENTPEFESFHVQRELNEVGDLSKRVKF